MDRSRAPDGTFAPWQSECRSIAPIGDPCGDGRVELASGTVLVGPLQHKTFKLAMSMGPDAIEVPIENIVSLTWQDWGSSDNSLQYSAPMATPEEAQWFRKERLSGVKSTY